MNKIILVCVALIGCAKVQPTTSITDTVKKDITTIQTSISNSNLSKTEKQELNARLEVLSDEVKNISVVCETEKKVILQEKSTLKTIIMWLITVIVALGLYIWKRK